MTRRRAGSPGRSTEEGLLLINSVYELMGLCRGGGRGEAGRCSTLACSGPRSHEGRGPWLWKVYFLQRPGKERASQKALQGIAVDIYTKKKTVPF